MSIVHTLMSIREVFGINIHILKSSHWFWQPQYLRANLRNWTWNWIQDLICRWHKDSCSKNQTNYSWFFWCKT